MINLQDAPILPPKTPMNVYGVSLARWALKGPDGRVWYYGPDRQPIPADIAAMAEEQQATVALENYRSQETQRQLEASAAVAAERAKEAEAVAEAERREQQEMEDEIERRAQVRAAELIAESRSTKAESKPAPARLAEPKPDPEPEPAPAPTAPAAPLGELAEILSTCSTRAALEEALTDVPWQHIKATVEKLGKTPGKKTENISILADYLELE